MVSWLINLDLATSILLMLTIISIVVIIVNDTKRSFNKLTLQPYYFMIGFCVLTVVENVSLNILWRNASWLAFINLNRANALFISIAI